MLEPVFNELKISSEKILAKLKEDIMSLRTGRATPALVENIPVESYGTTLPLKQVAALNVSQPNVIVIQPWDKNMVQPIEQTLRAANIGLSPVVESNIIRLTLPPLTEERRRELLKVLVKKTEEAKINFRLIRDEARRKIQTLFEEKGISEDNKYRANERLQKEVDEFNKILEEVVAKKEKEIMTV